MSSLFLYNDKRFLSIQRIEVPGEFVDEMYEFFRDSGRNGFESVALWAGEQKESCYIVSHLLFPEQTVYRMANGLGYKVSGEELERINYWLYKNKKTLIAQIHSHPEEAFHSDVDDEFAIVTTVGSLSVVIPDFGYTDKRLNGSAFFRLLPEGWTEINQDQISSLIKIIK